MILYHIGKFEIKEPDIHHGRKNADFAQGFYLSDDLEFSLKWATFDKDSNTYLNKYELDLNNLKVHELKKDREWFDYIYKNRNNYPDSLNEYDVIIGPIANDILYNTLGITTSGMLDLEKSYNLLILGNSYTQIVIKTEKANSNLKFLESKIIKEEDVTKLKKKLKSEEKKFQKLFFKTLKRL